MAKYVRFYSFAIVCSQWKTFLYQFLLSKSSHGRVLFHIKVFLQYWFEHSALWVKFFCKKMPHFSSFCNQKNFLSTIYRFTSAKIVFLFLTTIDQKQGDYPLGFFLYLFPQPEPKCSGILDRVNALLNTVSFILHTTNHLHMYDEII